MKLRKKWGMYCKMGEWKEFDLGGITTIKGRIGWKGLKSSEYVERGYPILTSYNLVNIPGGLDYTKKINKVSKERYDESPEIKIMDGDILMSKISSKVGFVKKLNTESTVNSTITIIRCFSEEIEPKFIYYYFKSPQFKKFFERNKKGTTMSSINHTALKKMKIRFPSFEIQKKIVVILEKAEGLKDKRKGLDELFDEYLKSVFYEMFLKRNFESTEIGNGILKTNNKNPGVDFPDKEFVYVDIASVDNVSKEIIESKKFLGKEAPSRARQQIKYKDVLVSTVRPNLNAVALVPKSLDNQICSTGYCILRADGRNLIPEFLFSVSRQDFFINGLVKKTKGANYPAVSSRDVKSFKIPFPPIELQEEFASIVEQIEKIKDKLKDEKKDADELFNALMQKAFSGELI